MKSQLADLELSRAELARERERIATEEVRVRRVTAAAKLEEEEARQLVAAAAREQV